MPQGEGAFAARDRAILKVFLYSGIRLGTACRLRVEDFHDDPEDRVRRIDLGGRPTSRGDLAACYSVEGTSSAPILFYPNFEAWERCGSGACWDPSIQALDTAVRRIADGKRRTGDER